MKTTIGLTSLNFATLQPHTRKQLNLLKDLYEHAYYAHPESFGSKIHEIARDILVGNNGQPLNILKAVTLLNECKSYIEIGKLNQETYYDMVMDISGLTAYTVDEILERLG